MAQALPKGPPQTIVVYTDAGGEDRVYSTGYTDEQVGAAEDACRRRYGKSSNPRTRRAT